EAPFGFHLSVVVFHAVSAGLVAMLGLRLFGSSAEGRLGALAAGVLFACHPIHAESVCWIAGRSDPLAAVFVLAASLCWTRSGGSSRTGLATIGTAVLVLLGCLAKETALAIVPVLIA